MKLSICLLFLIVILNLCYAKNVNRAKNIIQRTKKNPENGLTDIIEYGGDFSGVVWSREQTSMLEFEQAFEKQCKELQQNYKSSKNVKIALKQAFDKIEIEYKITREKIHDKYVEIPLIGVPFTKLGFNDIERIYQDLLSKRVSKVDGCDTEILRRSLLKWKENGQKCIAEGVSQGQIFSLEYAYQLIEIYGEVKNALNGIAEEDTIKQLKEATRYAVDELRDMAKLGRLEYTLSSASECMADVHDDAENDEDTIIRNNPQCFTQ